MVLKVVRLPDAPRRLPDLVERETPDRLQVRRSAAIFRADARREGKFGLTPLRSTGKAGSFDPDANLLVIVKFNVDPTKPYVADMMKREHLSRWVTADDSGWADLATAVERAGLVGKTF